MSINWKMVRDRAIPTTADQYEVIYDLSTGTIFSDLERPSLQGNANIDAEYVINSTSQTHI